MFRRLEPPRHRTVGVIALIEVPQGRDDPPHSEEAHLECTGPFSNVLGIQPGGSLDIIVAKNEESTAMRWIAAALPLPRPIQQHIVER